MFYMISFYVSWGGGEGCLRGGITFLFLATPEDILVHDSHLPSGDPYWYIHEASVSTFSAALFITTANIHINVIIIPF